MRDGGKFKTFVTKLNLITECVSQWISVTSLLSTCDLSTNYDACLQIEKFANKTGLTKNDNGYTISYGVEPFRMVRFRIQKSRFCKSIIVFKSDRGRLHFGCNVIGSAPGASASPCSPTGRRTGPRTSCSPPVCRPSLVDRGTSDSNPRPFACWPATTCPNKITMSTTCKPRPTLAEFVGITRSGRKLRLTGDGRVVRRRRIRKSPKSQTFFHTLRLYVVREFFGGIYKPQSIALTFIRSLPGEFVRRAQSGVELFAVVSSIFKCIPVSHPGRFNRLSKVLKTQSNRMFYLYYRYCVKSF